MAPPPLKQTEAGPDESASDAATQPGDTRQADDTGSVPPETAHGDVPAPETADAAPHASPPDASAPDTAEGDGDARAAGESTGSPVDLDLAAAGPDDDGFDDDELEELNDTIDPEDLDEFEALVEHGVAGDTAGPAHADLAALAAGEIPMLTEVVQVPRYDTGDLPQTLSEVNWGELGQRVRENVLERLLRRSDALLDAQLQNTLTPVLERAAEAVAHELHDALNRMIRDIVARAVTEELTRLHAEIAKRNRSTRPS